MKRRKIAADERVEVRMSLRDRELLLEHTFVDPEYAQRLRAVPGKSGLVAGYTLDDLEDILGHIAAEANHTEDRKLQEELDALYERLAAVQESYDDGSGQENAV